MEYQPKKNGSKYEAPDLDLSRRKTGALASKHGRFGEPVGERILLYIVQFFFPM